MVSSPTDLGRCVAGVRVDTTVAATLPVFAASTRSDSRAPRRSARRTSLGQASATRTPPERHRDCQDDQIDQPKAGAANSFVLAGTNAGVPGSHVIWNVEVSKDLWPIGREERLEAV